MELNTTLGFEKRTAGREINWSGMRESNPRLDLGKVAYYHYTNPARTDYIYSMASARGQDTERSINPVGFQEFASRALMRQSAP